MFLSDIELVALTGKRRRHAQRRVLRELRIPHRVRPDGRPLVHPADLPLRGEARTEPNWGAL
jgi:hypothetical protein